MNENKYSKGIFYLLSFIAFIVALAVLKVTASFFLPLTISILFSFIFYPFVKKLSQFKIPWILAVVIMLGLTLFLFSIILERIFLHKYSFVKIHVYYNLYTSKFYHLVILVFLDAYLI